MNDPNHIDGLALVHGGTSLLNVLDGDPTLSTFGRWVRGISRELGPNLLGRDTGTEGIAKLANTTVQAVTRMSVEPTLVGMGTEVVIRIDTYSAWKKWGLPVDPDDVDELFRRSTKALLGEEYYIRRAKNGTLAVLIDVRTDSISADPRPKDYLRHSLIIAGLLCG